MSICYICNNPDGGPGPDGVHLCFYCLLGKDMDIRFLGSPRIKETLWEIPEYQEFYYGVEPSRYHEVLEKILIKIQSSYLGSLDRSELQRILQFNHINYK